MKRFKPVKLECIVDFVLRLVVLHLQTSRRMLQILDHVADVGGLGLALLYGLIKRF